MTNTTPLYDAPKVGGDILAYCGKCKQDLAHVIIAMLKTKPARVQCKTCKSPHNYKLGPGTPRKAKSGLPREAAPKKVIKNAEYWEKKLAEAKGAQVAYAPTAVFTKGDVIQHTKFGVGLIEEVRLDRKIVVLFRDAERLLVHSMGK